MFAGGITTGTPLSGEIIYDTEAAPWSESPSYGHASYWPTSFTVDLGNLYTWTARLGHIGLVISNDRDGVGYAHVGETYDEFSVEQKGYFNNSLNGTDPLIYTTFSLKDLTHSSFTSSDLPTAARFNAFNVTDTSFYNFSVADYFFEMVPEDDSWMIGGVINHWEAT